MHLANINQFLLHPYVPYLIVGVLVTLIILMSFAISLLMGSKAELQSALTRQNQSLAEVGMPLVFKPEQRPNSADQLYMMEQQFQHLENRWRPTFQPTSTSYETVTDKRRQLFKRSMQYRQQILRSPPAA